MGLIILIIDRTGGDEGADIPWTGNNPFEWDLDGYIFGHFVVYAYFFILCVQIIGVILGDRSSVQSTLFALLGFIFWLSIGIMIIAKTEKDAYKDSMCYALGSLAIINSLIYAAEGVLHLLNLRKDDD